MDKRIVLDAMKVVELKEICKKSNIIGLSGKKKKEIIDIMIDCDLKYDWTAPVLVKEHLPIILEELEDDSNLELDELNFIPEELEEIILHIPKQVVEKNNRWKCFYEKGKKILNK